MVLRVSMPLLLLLALFFFHPCKLSPFFFFVVLLLLLLALPPLPLISGRRLLRSRKPFIFSLSVSQFFQVTPPPRFRPLCSSPFTCIRKERENTVRERRFFLPLVLHIVLKKVLTWASSLLFSFGYGMDRDDQRPRFRPIGTLLLKMSLTIDDLDLVPPYRAYIIIYKHGRINVHTF